MRTVLSRGRRAFVVAAATMVLLGGCGEERRAGGKLRVVATTTQLGDFARAIGGPKVEVETLLEPGIDPHDFEPRPSDAKAVAQADVVLRSGGEVDGWLGDLVESAGGDADVVVVGEEIGVDLEDPHWWQDPRNVVKASAVIGRAVEGDGGPFGQRVLALDREIAACMRAVPAERRKLVTNHDAYGWFARRYDIEVLGSILPGLSTSAQPSAKDIRELVEKIRAAGVTTIFPESALDQRLEEAVARDAGAKVGETLYGDTLGREGSYLRALGHDAAAMARGFGGDCDL